MKKKWAVLNQFREIMPWVIGALTVISSNLAASAIYDSATLIFGEEKLEISWLKLFYLIFFVMMIFLLYKERYAFFKPRTRFLRSEEPECREHLILFLSELINPEHKNKLPIALTGDLSLDIKMLENYKESNPPWKWEMPLRAIAHHLSRLKSVTIVCSNESILQAQLFCRVIKVYKNSKLLKNIELKYFIKENNYYVEKNWEMFKTGVPPNIKGLNFEDFDELSFSILKLCKMLSKRGISEREIIIDFTGGLKVTSVIAAAITFNKEIKAQYVQTYNPWDVKGYDFVYASSETPGF